MLCPITYSVALLLYLSTIGAISFNYNPGSAFWLAMISNILCYGIAIHYKACKNQL